MKEEKNNEIDLLLRRLSRRQDGAVPDGDFRIDTDHLDADELSSYAENALPAAARLRYTEHLADCARCRELVVQLGSAVGVVVADEPARVPAPSGLRKFLASLFSPMVLRYAVPAMGLIVVAVIGVVVVRDEGGFMARRAMPTNAPVADTPKQQQEPSLGFYDQQQQLKHDSLTTPEARAGRVKPPVVAGEESGAAAPAPVGSPTDATKTTATAEQPARGQAQTPASEPAPPPAAKPAETVAEIRKGEPEVKKEEAQGRFTVNKDVDQQQVQTKLQENERSKDVAAGKSRPAKEKAAAGTGTQSLRSPSPATARRDSDENYVADAETRSVAGRHFRKQRGIWVDTAYNDGATVNLTRGSEQYRALVADEPDLKKIADQLDGQIIVVWKGRTYRIR